MLVGFNSCWTLEGNRYEIIEKRVGNGVIYCDVFLGWGILGFLVIIIN